MTEAVNVKAAAMRAGVERMAAALDIPLELLDPDGGLVGFNHWAMAMRLLGYSGCVDEHGLTLLEQQVISGEHYPGGV